MPLSSARRQGAPVRSRRVVFSRPVPPRRVRCACSQLLRPSRATTPDPINFGHDDSLDAPQPSPTPAPTTPAAGGPLRALPGVQLRRYAAAGRPARRLVRATPTRSARPPPNGHPEFVLRGQPDLREVPLHDARRRPERLLHGQRTWEEPTDRLRRLRLPPAKQRHCRTRSRSPQAASTADPESRPRPLRGPIAGDPNSSTPARQPGTYVVYVDNWCSNQHDPLDLNWPRSSAASCQPPRTPRSPTATRTTSSGSVTFTAVRGPDNKLPFGLAVRSRHRQDQHRPDVHRRRQRPDASTDPPRFTYSFDLDGDGRFEYDNGKSGTVTARFPNAGVFNVGVRASDDRGGVAYASQCR